MRANTGSFVADSLMPLIPRLTNKDDIVLLNFGLHSNDNGTLYNYIQVQGRLETLCGDLVPVLPSIAFCDGSNIVVSLRCKAPMNFSV